jgi:hypothetical protein
LVIRINSIRSISLLLSFVVSLCASFSHAAEPVVVAEGTGKQSPKQPQAVVGADGTIHLAYGVADAVFYCSSHDAGASFSAAKLAFKLPNMSLGMRRGPRIAATDKQIVITAIGGPQGKGRDGDIFAWRSSDAGASWQGPVQVNDTAASAREGLHAMAADSSVGIWCVWLDLRSKRTELYASQSSDGGASWSENTLVYKSPDGSICECCHPSIVVSGKAVHVLFRNSLDGNRDMYLVSSVDGKRFEPAKRLGSESWQLNACPMDGGMLSVEQDGTVATAWRRGGLVFATAKDSGKEILLGRGEQPWLAPTARGSIAVWTGARDGELLWSSLTDREAHSVAPLARDPVIATSPTGKGAVFLCWEKKEGDKVTIQAQTLDAP